MGIQWGRVFLHHMAEEATPQDWVLDTGGLCMAGAGRLSWHLHAEQCGPLNTCQEEGRHLEPTQGHMIQLFIAP